MPYQPFEADLVKLGLDDKAAAVYLAALVLGPSSVLQISRKSKVARATTYLMLSRLMDEGLISTYEKENKKYYIAEEPGHLHHYIESQQEKLSREKEHLNDVIPKLRAFMWSQDLRPTVRYYHGKEGLHVLRSDMLRVSQAGDMWYNFSPIDRLVQVFGEEEFAYHRQRRAKGIRSMTIFTTKNRQIKEKVLAEADGKRIFRRYIPPQQFKSASGVTILRDRVAVGILDGELGGFIVESRSVAETARELFELAWGKLEKKS